MERGREAPWLVELKRLARGWTERATTFARDWYAAARREYRGLTPERVFDRWRRELSANRRLKTAAYVLAVSAWGVAIVWARILVPLDTAPFPRPAGGFEVIGFFESDSGGFFGDSLPTLEENADLFNTVSPFWYSIDPDGTVTEKGYRPEVVAFARSRGLLVIPLVTNAKEGPGNAAAVVTEPGLRTRTVDALAEIAAERGYDGLDLSLQLLPIEARDGYTAFVEELASALRAQGKRLTVSVFPEPELPPQISGFIDFAAVGRAADRVILQSYDRHWTLTPPGPISPLPWVEASLERLLTLIPPGKVILGIGAHAYDWPQDPDQGIPEYLPTEAALRRAALTKAEVIFDPASRQSYFTYRGSTGLSRVVWVQDAAHLVDKVELARRYRLAGVALWRLGFTEAGALDQLRTALTGGR